MAIPADYLERVYAGVLGKLIGVYLGRPFEGWGYDRIMAELGEVTGYVHERFGAPLVVTDDDVSGTFTFLRALPNYGNQIGVTPAQIGETWMNYIIEKKTILWWGGMGNSTEHTAFLRMKRGIPAPLSGSIELNGKVVAEQIGSQIFIDGWAMVAPGDPELAADLARRASSVSHDGEAIYGAQVIAAMEALAFVEPSLPRLLDAAVALIPRDSVIYRMIDELREWRDETPNWRTARELLERGYGYDRYGGNCHMVPNHGVIILSLLYGNDDLRTSLMIANTSGWDTDCNSGNVGCLLGIKHGLAAIDAGAYDWRGPVADRLYLPTADGGRAITDAVAETYHVVNIGRALAGEAPLAPKGGARFHFSLPGSVQGFLAEGGVAAANQVGRGGERALALTLAPGQTAGRAMTATFIPTEALSMPGSYALLAAPTIYPGQGLRAQLSAPAGNSAPLTARLLLRAYSGADTLTTIAGPAREIAPGGEATIAWEVPETGGQPIAQVGVEIESAAGGRADLEWLTWSGEPRTRFTRPGDGGSLWRRMWVAGLDSDDMIWPEAFRVVQNEGRGLLMTGADDWRRYAVSSTITPHLATSFGVAARVQGLRRFYALLLCRTPAGLGVARLIKALDGDQILAEAMFDWSYGTPYHFTLAADGGRLRGTLREGDGPSLSLEAADVIAPLAGGGIALVVEEGRIAAEAVEVAPIV